MPAPTVDDRPMSRPGAFQVAPRPGVQPQEVRVERAPPGPLRSGPGYSVYRVDKHGTEEFVTVLAGERPVLNAVTDRQFEAWSRATLMGRPVTLVRSRGAVRPSAASG